MSLLRRSMFENFSARMDAFSTRKGRKADRHYRKPRRLGVDPLEKREMLSVTVGDLDDGLVNQQYSGQQSTENVGALRTDRAQAVAADDDGDFVVAWTRYDATTDVFGQPSVEANIYARYFTDEVQRITLPSEVLTTGAGPNDLGRFRLTYGSKDTYAIQKLTFSATYEPYRPDFFQSPISGTFELGFDVNRNGAIEPNERQTFFYNESQSPDVTANNLQQILHGLGGALDDAQVQAVNAREFVIKFGPQSQGKSQPNISVLSSNFTSGFYPSVEVASVRPAEIAVDFGANGIPVSPTDPWQTAAAIEQAFLLASQRYMAATSTNTAYGPVNIPPANPPAGFAGPHISPAVLQSPVLQVAVRPVGGSKTQFDITFVGSAAKKDHPELIVAEVKDGLGKTVDAANVPLVSKSAVATIKQSSDEFRVNAPETFDDPYTLGTDKFNQHNPAIAMDADGDFVITWESEVPQAANPGSVSDIFARRFTAQAMRPVAEITFESDGRKIQGVRPLSDQFQVNQFTTNQQREPSIGMDNAGNFTIAWTNEGQGVSFFNSIYARRYDMEGQPLGGEFIVNQEETNTNHVPFVAMSNDGHTLITWSETADRGAADGGLIFVSVQMLLYSPSGQVLLPTQVVSTGGGMPWAAFDNNNNFLVTYQALFDADPAGTSTGVRGTMYDITGAVIRPEFRINSASFAPDSPVSWFSTQNNSTIGLDADGDLVVGYEGVGADVSVDVFVAQSIMAAEINPQKNADLLAFFPGGFLTIFSEVDVDGAIEDVLVQAISLGANSEQIGRLSAVLEKTVGLLRGEGYGILYSQFDADPGLGPRNIIWSDNAASSQRDGRNHRELLVIDDATASGQFTIRLRRQDQTGFEDIAVAIATNAGGGFDPEGTRENIESALAGAARSGDQWSPDTRFEGPIQVRLISLFEMQSRENTPWAYPSQLLSDPFSGQPEWVYEITFQGTAHDVGYSLEIRNSNVQPQGTPAPYRITRYYGDQGIDQVAPSMAMEPDGDFVMVWTQHEERTGDPFGTTNQNIMYRRFDESTDTAGPNLVDIFLADGTRIRQQTPAAEVTSAVQYLIVSIDEELAQTGINGVNSATNPANWQLLRNGIEMVGAIKEVHFGMNRAADLAASLGLNPLGANRWEAVIVLDGDAAAVGNQKLPEGEYRLVAKSSLTDRPGNALGRTGFTELGFSQSRSFFIPPSNDGGGGGGGGGSTPDLPADSLVNNGRTFPETPGAVAEDADGDHVIVWTAFDTVTGRDKVFVRLLKKDGSPADTKPTTFSVSEGELGFAADVQRYASVAMDADGDFIVTWTNFRGGTSGDADIYARRFNAAGAPLGASFRVNTFGGFDASVVTPQLWSDVAMDADGDFVVTWSSFSQEDNGQMGSGYGVYARRYDSYGQPLSGEFRVNVTTEGNQSLSRVAMDALGGFVVVWVSDQNNAGGAGTGTGTDIVARSFWPDGSPMDTVAGTPYLYGETIVNQTVQGNQLYPDVAMTDNGQNYIVTWSGPDSSGNGVFGRVLGRSVDGSGGSRVSVSGTLLPGSEKITDASVTATATTTWTLNVVDNFDIYDLDLRLNLLHQRVSDLTITLTGPGGQSVVISDRQPQGTGGTFAGGANFINTVFDDEASLRLDQGQPPYTGRFRPGNPLSAFDGQLSSGTWTLSITDNASGPFSSPSVTADALLQGWSLDFGVGRFEAGTLVPATRATTEFQINSSTVGDQSFPSVAASATGNFVVTWSGRGDQQFQQDLSGHGVFFQRYDSGLSRLGIETRINRQVEGEQRYPSVAADADGNFVIAWTGVGSPSTTTAVYRFNSLSSVPLLDVDAPIVTDVYAGTRRLLQGDLVDQASSITVLFSEAMSERVIDIGGGIFEPGPDSIENPSNWVLSRNGIPMPGAIRTINFQFNAATRKYEAVLTFDGDQGVSGDQPLPAGVYTLTVLDTANDVYGVPKPSTPYFSGHGLDGDFDGFSGTLLATGNGVAGYQFGFTITSGAAQSAAEFRLNDQMPREQTFSQRLGTGLGLEESTRSVAVDHDGDFVVVWTSYGQDDPTNLAGAGVYFRLYDRNNNPLTPETLVNTNVTLGNQWHPSVAMDADGDFVVAWESENASIDGTPDIFVRRYDSKGRAQKMYDANGVQVDAPVKANTTVTGRQFNPAVAMDLSGNFVVVWGTAGQQFSYLNDIRGQLYTADGRRTGTEFNVNEVSFTSADAGNAEANPTVAMDRTGNFMVAWDRVTSQSNGTIQSTDIFARVFDSQGFPNATNPTEFAIPSSVWDRNPQIATDGLGNFIVAWETYNPADLADPAGVWYVRLDAAGAVLDNAQQAEMVTGGSQVNASVAMDADGDFALAWNGNGAVPNPLAPLNPNLWTNFDSEGVWTRLFHAGGPANTAEPVSVQTRVNMTTSGIQQFPSVGMEPDGDRIVVWSGGGVGDSHGIFARRYDEATDTAGPLVTDLYTIDGKRVRDFNPATGQFGVITDPVNKLVVIFDEQMSTTGDSSVLEPRNWQFLKDGVPVREVNRNGYKVSEAITGITFGLNPNTNRWEAIVSLAGNLPSGQYTLRALSSVQKTDPSTGQIITQVGMTDVVGNPLGRNGVSVNGAPMLVTFQVSSTGTPDTPVGVTNSRTFPDTPGATAMDQDGDHVVVWTAFDTARQTDRVYWQLYGANGASVGGPFEVSGAALTGTQRFGSVAMDPDGDFIVTWTQYQGKDANPGDADIYARRFNAAGAPLAEAFRVNTFGVAGSTIVTQQKWSDVAMDADGDFVITWSSFSQEDNGQLGSSYGIYARRYDSFGTPLASNNPLVHGEMPSAEFRVNVTTGGEQKWSRVSMNALGGFVIVWQSSQDGAGTDIFSRVFAADGSPLRQDGGYLSGETLINETLTDGNQTYPDVAMVASGNSYLVSWSGPSSTLPSGNEVFAREMEVFTNVLVNQSFTYQPAPPLPSPGLLIPHQGQRVSTINVPDSFTISDVNVSLTVEHPRLLDLTIELVSPTGTVIPLVRKLPGANYTGTTFDDAAGIRIGAAGSAAPFSGTFQTQLIAGSSSPNTLASFNSQQAQGDWLLRIIDDTEGPYLVPPSFIDPSGVPNNAYLISWSLEFTASSRGSAEVLVNTTTSGDQTYSSVAVDAGGDYIVAWSGRGDQSSQQDTSGHGVFYQRLSKDLVKLGGEARVNTQTTGNQWFPSIDVDGDGNFVVAWTEQALAGGPAQVYKYASGVSSWLGRPDIDSPIVTEVRTVAGGPVVNDGVIQTPQLTQLIVAFSEDLSQRKSENGGVVVNEPGPDSVLNPANWALRRNGVEIPRGIHSISFQWNPQTRKHEALVTFDADSLATGVNPLAPGNYTLVMRDSIRDLYSYVAAAQPIDPFFQGHAIDGDLDGVPGTVLGLGPGLNGLGTDGFEFRFTLPDARNQAEFLVNGNVGLEQTLTADLATGFAVERSNRSVAADADGDFVVTWTSYGEDDPTDPAGAGVYFRRYTRIGGSPVAVGDQQRVNTTTKGNQRNASVAIDADGDFVIVWEGDVSGPGGLSKDIFFQRYTAAGVADGPETRVNTETVGNQYNPSVAMDPFGNFVVAWASASQPYSFFNKVHAQLFDFRGAAVGAEFIVSEFGVLPGTVPGAPASRVTPGSIEVNPSVAMDYQGNFSIVWDQVSQASNGVVLDTEVWAQMFGADGLPRIIVNPQAGQSQFMVPFRVDTGTVEFTDPTHTLGGQQGGGGGTQITRAARNPQAAMDRSGSLTVVWESFSDVDRAGAGAADSYGIYFRRFLADGTPDMAGDHQANLVVTAQQIQQQPGQGSTGYDPTTLSSNQYFALDQVNPSIAVDADGDYAIVWNGNGAVPHPLDPANPRLVTNRDIDGVWMRQFHAAGTTVGSEGEYVGVQQRVNMTGSGVQQFPSIAMTPEGDRIVVWSGSGVGDRHGVFARFYDEPTDSAGPLATELRSATGQLIGPGEQLLNAGTPQSLVVVFSEQMDTTSGLYSVTNTNNWALIDAQGNEVAGAIGGVTFGRNSVSGKWEATVSFRSEAFGQTAGTGLPNGQYRLMVRTDARDLAGNRLARTGFVPGGIDLQNPVTSPTGGMAFNFRVHTLTPGSPLGGDADPRVNDIAPGNQVGAAVARAANGNYMVVWADEVTVPVLDANGNPVIDPVTQQPQTTVNAEIRARMYDAFDRPMRLRNGSNAAFTVNSLTAGSQIDPAVAVDGQGNFIVVWNDVNSTVIAGQPAGTLGDTNGIQAQRFMANGDRLGGQFRVNVTVDGLQNEPSVAADTNGNFVVTWRSSTSTGGSQIVARRYDATGAPTTGELVVNSSSGTQHETPTVNMAADGSQFVVAWAAGGLDSSGRGIFARRYSGVGVAQGTQFQVNSLASGEQYQPSIAMDADGDFAVAWTGIDANGYGVYARRFTRAGSGGAEFRVNETTTNHQYQPAAAMTPDGKLAITWATYDQEGSNIDSLGRIVHDYGIFGRLYNADGSDFVVPNRGRLGEFRVNATTAGNQMTPAIGGSGDGNFSIVWVGPDYYQSVIPPAQPGGTPTVAQVSGGGGIYSRLIDPPTASPTVATPGNLAVNGTAGSDTLEFVANASATSWVLKLNGQTVAVPAGTTTVSFDGLGGSDKVIFTGTAASDKVELWPNRVEIRAVGYSFSATNIENAVIDAKTGDDELLLHDSSGNDVLHAWFDNVTIVGPGYSHSVKSVETVNAEAAAGGYDTASLYDTAGNETFIARPDYGQMTGNGFFRQARLFEEIHGYASAGGYDVAQIFDSAGNDEFIARPTYAKIAGSGLYRRAKGFDEVYASAELGGIDTASLYGSTGADSFVASPVDAKMTGTGFMYMATTFEYVHGYAVGANNDVAVLKDSPGADILTATPQYAKLVGPGFYNRAKGFGKVTAEATAGGMDAARMYDSTGNDTFTARPEMTRMTGLGFDNGAAFFESVQGFADAGGVDTASLYDTPGNDTFTSNVGNASLSGSGFSARAARFDYVHGYSLAGGNDTARLYDSAGDDVYTGMPDYGRIQGNGYFARVKYFDSVMAYATAGGNDEARLYSAAGSDKLQGAKTYMQLSGSAFNHRTEGFEMVKAYGIQSAQGGANSAVIYDATLKTEQEANAQSAQATGTPDAWLYYFSKLERKDSANPAKNTVTSVVDGVFAAYWD